MAGNQPLHPEPDAARLLAIAPDGATLLVAATASPVHAGATGLRLLEVATGKRLPLVLPEGWPSVVQAAFYDGGRGVLLLGNAGAQSRMACYDTATGTERPAANLAGALDGSATRFIVTPDGRTLITDAFARSGFKFWDTATWQVRSTLRSTWKEIAGLAVSPDGKTLYASTNESWF